MSVGRSAYTMLSTLLLMILAVLFVAVVVRLYQKSTNAKCTSAKRLGGRTAIVTGGTTGIGLQIAKDLARRGARVIVACPFEKEGLEALKTIETETNQGAVFKLLDLGSMKSVRAFAEDVLKTEQRLDLLVNNAGIVVPKDFSTEDGINVVMQVNYYGHFLLTILLLPLLKKSGRPSEPSRIINTSSILSYIGRMDFENMNRSGYYWLPAFPYANSKLCLVLFSIELTKRLRGADVVVNSVDPGAVGTNIHRSFGRAFDGFMSHLYYYLYKTPWEGAQTALHVSLDEKAGAVSGELFKNCKCSRATLYASDDELPAKLWEESVKLVKLTEKEIAYCLN